MSETHEAIEGNAVIREVLGLLERNTESVGVEGETSDDDVVLDHVARYGAGAVRDLELLAKILEGGRALGAKELVVALEKREKRAVSTARQRMV